MKKKIAIIGAGPAGLTAGYQLIKKNFDVDIYEAKSFPGGMSASIDLWGNKVDLGPHRFFSSDINVNKFWLEIIENDYQMVSRKTRIYYQKKFFNYPLKPLNALSKLGIFTSMQCLTSYLKTFFNKKKNIINFEDWVTLKFGKKLFEIFFKDYSEKLWGIPCTKLSADFAAQRIKKFSLGEAIKAVFSKNKKKHKTLVDEFAYPNHGTGFFYEKLATKFTQMGGKIFYNTKIEKIVHTENQIELYLDNKKENFNYLISSMPIHNLVENLQPNTEVRNSLSQLQFRNTLLVYVKVDKKNLFDDQWLYINSKDIRSGRVTNFNNWGQNQNNEFTILCFEYWFNHQDEIWVKKDMQSIRNLISQDCETLGFFEKNKILEIKFIPINNCYPIYDISYKEHLKKIKLFLDKFENIFAIGRYGSFKYNNQDHSILMGLMVEKKITENKEINLWDINTDYEFQEQAIITQTGLQKI